MKVKDSIEIKKEERIKWPKVAIIILNWNGWKDTIECLESVFRNTYPNYQVIVVDNGSEGNDADVLEEKYKNYIKVIRNKENLGFCGGNNVGIKDAVKNSSEYVLLLNNDTTVEPNFLDELVKIALRDEKIAIIGSVVAGYYTEKIVFTNSKIDKKLKAEAKLDYLDSKKDYWVTERVSGASMIIKTEHLLKYSLFLDENLFMYCDEMDLCLRARQKGLRVEMAGKSIIYHKEDTLEKLLNPIAIYYVIRNRILLAKKLLDSKDRIIFWLLFIPARLFRCLEWIFKGRFELIKMTFLAFRDGIGKRIGKMKK